MVAMPKAQILDQLRALVAQNDPSFAPSQTQSAPWLGMNRGGLHEIAPLEWRDGPAALGFVLGRIALETPAPFVWLDHPALTRDFGIPYGPGLKGFGLDPAALIHIEARRDQDLLWAMEEAARIKGLSAVIGCLPGQSRACTLTATRRLALAAQQNDALVLLLRDAGTPGLSAARTRWQVCSAPSQPFSQDLSNPLDSSGSFENILGTLNRPAPPRWQLTLDRCRTGKPGSWLIEWHNASLCFDLSSPSCDRPDQAERPVRRAG